MVLRLQARAAVSNAAMPNRYFILFLTLLQYAMNQYTTSFLRYIDISIPDLCIPSAKNHGKSWLDGQLRHVALQGIIKLKQIEVMLKLFSQRNKPVSGGGTGKVDI